MAKEKHIHLRVNEAFTYRLNKAAELTDVPASQLVREAVTKELDKMSKRFPQLARENFQQSEQTQTV